MMLKFTRFFFLTSIASCLTFCGVKEKENKRNLVLEEVCALSGLQINDSTKALIILNDLGCPSCNQKFCDLISKEKNNRAVRFIISANPNMLDFSGFLEASGPNVFIDKTHSLEKKMEIPSSIFYGLSHQTIDTIIHINPKDYENKISYILKMIRE